MESICLLSKNEKLGDSESRTQLNKGVSRPLMRHNEINEKRRVVIITIPSEAEVREN